jgi:cytochrome c
VLSLSGPWGRTDPGFAVHEPPPGTSGDFQRGAKLFQAYDCQRCHTQPRSGHGINAPAGLVLQGSRSRYDWLVSYLRDPKPLRYRSEGVRPRIRMPALEGSSQDAQELAAFLIAQTDTARVPIQPGSDSWAADSSLVETGRELFSQYQCRGCHELASKGKQVGPALDGVAERRQPDYVYALLRDPQRIIPGTAMEDKGLWEEEARALTAYLMTRGGGSASH